MAGQFLDPHPHQHMATETVRVKDSRGQDVKITAELPDRLRNERGEVYERATGSVTHDWLRIRLTDEELAKYRAGGHNPPQEVTADPHPTHVRLDGARVEVVQLDALSRKGDKLMLRMEGRPDLQALVDNVQARDKAIGAARDAYWAEVRTRGQRAIETRARELQAALPEGRVIGYFVRVESDGSDGWGDREIYRTLDGRTCALDGRLGMEAASDERTGTGGYITYISIPEEAIEAQQEADRAERKRKNAAALQAWHAREDRKAALQATEVPTEAVAAYEACGGDPENFRDGHDDPRYWLVRKWADAIEAQGLAHPTGVRLDPELPRDEW